MRVVITCAFPGCNRRQRGITDGSDETLIHERHGDGWCLGTCDRNQPDCHKFMATPDPVARVPELQADLAEARRLLRLLWERVGFAQALDREVRACLDKERRGDT